LITEYTGQLIGKSDADRLRQLGHHTHVRVVNFHHLYIDGLKEPLEGHGGASFANDAKDSTLNNAVYTTM
jgi:hypothetical protein